MLKFRGPVVAVEVAVRVKVTSRKPPAGTLPPTELNVTPVGRVPPCVMTKVCELVPVFSMHAYLDCEPPTGTDHVVMDSPVSAYVPVVAEHVVVDATSTTAKRLVPTLTTLPVLLTESCVAAYAT